MRWALLLMALLAGMICPVAAQQAGRPLEEVVQEQYPDFIRRETPRAADAATTPTIADDPAGSRRYTTPELLVEDPASTRTWSLLRERSAAELEEIRILMLTRAAQEEVHQRAQAFLAMLDAMVVMAEFQAPLQEGGMSLHRDRIRRQVNYLVEDYASEKWRQLETSDRLLRDSMQEWDQLLIQSDLDRGAAPVDFYRIPDDWVVGRFSDPEFAERIKAWDSRRLLAEYDDRVASIEEQLKRKSTKPDLEASREMGELARALAARLYDVPVTSRTGFRDAALRLDVMAENLHDYLGEGNSIYARRQIRYIRRGVEDAEAYLALGLGASR